MKNPDMLTESYDYELPPQFIADRPVEGRANSKLLIYHAKTDRITHSTFSKLADYLSAEHLVVLNQSKVFPCRLFAHKVTGGKAEIFLLSLLNDKGHYPCFIRSNGKKSVGDKFIIGHVTATIIDKKDNGEFLLSFDLVRDKFLDFLESNAKIPIPPYIRDGIADERDTYDYQTVYAKEVGSVAAPTAGLHFNEDVFSTLHNKGIDKAFVTLHVGAGTFKPVNVDDISEHQMHSEFYKIEAQDLDKINKAKKIIAVGTTTLRVLESSLEKGSFKCAKDGFSSTNIFIYPGKEVRSIDGLITNFHLPKSTLIMLVSALIGREKTLELYEVAKENHYRFFSYGDAMLILRS